MRPIPPIPVTGWTPPKELPNLFHAKVIGIDLETYDPELKTHGAGWARGVGEICGISLSTHDGFSCYLPIRHRLEPQLNMNPDNVLSYLSDLLALPMPKVGANLIYDLGWLKQEGVEVKGKLYDVLYAEAILYDTAKKYDLNSVATRWVGEQKVDSALYEWAARAYGGAPDRKQAGNIYRSPLSLVGPYAEADARLPLDILALQWKELERLNLMNIFNLECDLIPVMLGMRFRGVPVSLEKAEKAKVYLKQKEEEAQQKLNKTAGFEVGVHTNAHLARLFDENKLSYPRTAKGSPSFTKDWLAANPHPLAGLINDVRKYNKARCTFIENGVINKEIGGKIYPSFHPLRGEDGGAVSGRFSSSQPNAQQIPSRDPELAPLVRGVYIPESGYPSWIKQDLSQIEYRFFAHYSGDERLIREYQDPSTDYHNVVSGFLGDLIPRKPIKNFNFMSLYGGGKGKVVKMLRAEFSKESAETLIMQLIGELPAGDVFVRLADVFIEMYSTHFPAAGESLQRDLEMAERTGEIRTILGRRSVFDLYEPISGKRVSALPFNEAIEAYGTSIKRAFCFRALNRRLQGSSADLLKKGMVDAYQAGVFDRIGFPHVTVHDELDTSYHPDLKGGFLELQEMIENAIPLKVPVIMGAEIGPNWGDVNEINLRGKK